MRLVHRLRTLLAGPSRAPEKSGPAGPDARVRPRRPGAHRAG